MVSEVDGFFDAALNIGIWSNIEPGLGIIAASLATLRPLFRHWLSGVRSRVDTFRHGSNIKSLKQDYILEIQSSRSSSYPCQQRKPERVVFRPDWIHPWRRSDTFAGSLSMTSPKTVSVHVASVGVSPPQSPILGPFMTDIPSRPGTARLKYSERDQVRLAGRTETPGVGSQTTHSRGQSDESRMQIQRTDSRRMKDVDTSQESFLEERTSSSSEEV